jgi:hypothetical protein
VVRRFAAEHGAWEGALDAAADLDALMSLAACAEAGGAQGPMCRPRLLPPQEHGQVQHVPFLVLALGIRVCWGLFHKGGILGNHG